MSQMESDPENIPAEFGLRAWHAVVRDRDPGQLDRLLADDVVFRSPVVHTPQEGKALTMMYLAGAMQVLANDSFRYVREVVQGDDAVLEFISDLDGVIVNGVDMIHFNSEGRIDSFTVMLRPMKGIQAVQTGMATLLAAATSKQG